MLEEPPAVHKRATLVITPVVSAAVRVSVSATAARFDDMAHNPNTLCRLQGAATGFVAFEAWARRPSPTIRGIRPTRSPGCSSGPPASPGAGVKVYTTTAAALTVDADRGHHRRRAHHRQRAVVIPSLGHAAPRPVAITPCRWNSVGIDLHTDAVADMGMRADF